MKAGLAKLQWRPAIKRVTLRTRKRAQLAAFYNRFLGFKTEADTSENTLLHLRNSRGKNLLALEEDLDAVETPRGYPGLFHIAFVVEDKEQWRALVGKMVRDGVDYHGSSDHGVSWAAYFSDPDGNGIEIAWDKPIETWPWNGDQIQMSTRYLHIEGDVTDSDPDAIRLELGHIHLTVGSLDEASSYCRNLDLRITQRDFPGAIFMARDNYHHHLAINTWGVNASAKRPENAIGLKSVDWYSPDRKKDSWTDSMGFEFNLSNEPDNHSATTKEDCPASRY